ncbi:MAG: hypothetical protein K0U98_12690 [Deltaproteobacteria bacterium]|nr:hypothetical protein [Deltaproteobacteria bacterium]
MNSPRTTLRRSWSYPFTRRWLLIATVWSVSVFAAILWLYCWPTIGSIEAQWKEKAGFDPLVAFPGKEPNEAARRVEDLSTQLGLTIAPTWDTKASNPSEQARARYGEVREGLSGFYFDLYGVEPVLAPLSPELESFLVDSEAALFEISALLREGEAPQWHSLVNEGFEGNGYNILGHLNLHKLLIVMSARAARRADTQECLEWLEAAWSLSLSVAEEPTTLPQLAALAAFRGNMAILRALDSPLPGWALKLEVPPWQRRMAAAYRLESWTLIRSFELGQLEKVLDGSRFANFLARPVVRHGLVGHIDFVERFLARARSGKVLEMDHEEVFEEETARIPRWNFYARLFVPIFADSMGKAARLELSTDLTRRVVEVRELLRADKIEILSGLQGSHPSVLEGISWIYQVEEDKVSIRADTEVFSTGEHPLPVEFSILRTQ